ncbi:MAG TPA: hypothetical protein VG078_06150, partial [Acidimicrobiales bacterium]|nr:hypothetical protein [Acidimicrobiales bacterium]
VLVDAAAFAAGALLVAATLASAIRTVVLPRGVQTRLTTAVFLAMRVLFRIRLGRAPSYERRDRVMAPYAPLSLLALALVWLALVGTGYAAMFWSLGSQPLREAVTLSGSSLFTLGFLRPNDLPTIFLAVTEASLGLILLALVITYLPSIYTAFSRREAAVAHLEVRAGSPPSGPEILERFARISWLGGLAGLWDRWEGWFVETEESHTSFPALVFFRSPQPEHSWVTAAGAVLDAAALASSTMEEHDPDAELMIRAGTLCLRRIADYFGLEYDPDPRPTDEITLYREEYDEAYDRLAAAGIKLKPDRDQAWRDFAGWRVNYDTVLVTLAGLVGAPYAPWSSDRSVRTSTVSLLRNRSRSARRGASRPELRVGRHWGRSQAPDEEHTPPDEPDAEQG